jgi:phosphomethylpyrimidine synthase
VIAAGLPPAGDGQASGLAEQDRKLSTARGNLDWETHLGTSIDPATADRMHREACQEIGSEFRSADYCSMCGQHWCSVRINREVREAIAGRRERS